MRKAKVFSAFAKGADDNNLTTFAYRRIRDAIINNEFKPGDCLSSPQLAKALNMSRTPVREALSVLASEGMVDIQNGVGIFVKELTEKEILELYEVRIALECASLESIIGEKNKLPMAKLDNLSQEWIKLRNRFIAGQLSNFEEVMLLDYITHDFIVKAGGNSFLIDLVANIKLRIRRIQYLSVVGLNDVPITIDQHLDLLDSIKNRELDRSIHLMKSHIRESVAYIFKNIKSESAGLKQNGRAGAGGQD